MLERKRSFAPKTGSDCEFLSLTDKKALLALFSVIQPFALNALLINLNDTACR